MSIKFNEQQLPQGVIVQSVTETTPRKDVYENDIKISTKKRERVFVVDLLLTTNSLAELKQLKRTIDKWFDTSQDVKLEFEDYPNWYYLATSKEALTFTEEGTTATTSVTLVCKDYMAYGVDKSVNNNVMFDSLIPNGFFINGINGWYIPDASEKPLGYRIYPNESPNGYDVLSVNATGVAVDFFSDFVEIKPNTTYSIGSNTLVHSSSEWFEIFAEIYDKDGVRLNKVYNYPISGSWELVVSTFTTDSNSAYVRFGWSIYNSPDDRISEFACYEGTFNSTNFPRPETVETIFVETNGEVTYPVIELTAKSPTDTALVMVNDRQMYLGFVDENTNVKPIERVWGDEMTTTSGWSKGTDIYGGVFNQFSLKVDTRTKTTFHLDPADFKNANFNDYTQVFGSLKKSVPTALTDFKTRVIGYWSSSSVKQKGKWSWTLTDPNLKDILQVYIWDSSSTKHERTIEVQINNVVMVKKDLNTLVGKSYKFALECEKKGSKWTVKFHQYTQTDPSMANTSTIKKTVTLLNYNGSKDLQLKYFEIGAGGYKGFAMPTELSFAWGDVDKYNTIVDNSILLTTDIGQVVSIDTKEHEVSVDGEIKNELIDIASDRLVFNRESNVITVIPSTFDIRIYYKEREQ